jgi:hypothetical protein
MPLCTALPEFRRKLLLVVMVKTEVNIFLRNSSNGLPGYTASQSLCPSVK